MTLFQKSLLGIALSAFVVLNLKCQSSVKNNIIHTSVDTVEVIQVVLNDDRLILEVLRHFKGQSIRLVTGPVIKNSQQFIFMGKPAQIVAFPENLRQIRELHPRELYVSVESVRFFSQDSATVHLLYHAGNSTEEYRLKKCDHRWFIVGYEYGKY